MLFQENEPLSIEDCLRVRRSYLPKTCTLHYEQNPVRIVRADKQYVYDDENNQFLDFYNCISHVGHCDKHIQSAASMQMRRVGPLDTLTDQYDKYVARLLVTLPQQFTECFFVQSGSEANQLAIQLCQKYTKKEDIVVFDEVALERIPQIFRHQLQAFVQSSLLG